MNLIKKIFNRDYQLEDFNKIMKLRKKIFKNTSDNIFSKIIKKIRGLKHNKICYKNGAFISLGSKIFVDEDSVYFPHVKLRDNLPVIK